MLISSQDAASSFESPRDCHSRAYQHLTCCSRGVFASNSGCRVASWSSVRLRLTASPSQITGDDTSAIQAVLDADVWRKHLLREQEVGGYVHGHHRTSDTERDDERIEHHRETDTTGPSTILPGRFVLGRRED